jgi:hypothetical protein
MKWGLRWPVGPFQVICVLAAVLLAAASPVQCGFAGHAGTSTDNRLTSNVGGWSKAGTMAIVSGGLNAANLKNQQNPSAMLDGRGVDPRRCEWR